MPRQLMKIQAFLELPRHFRKCQISSNACDMAIGLPAIQQLVYQQRKEDFRCF